MVAVLTCCAIAVNHAFDQRWGASSIVHLSHQSEKSFLSYESIRGSQQPTLKIPWLFHVAFPWFSLTLQYIFDLKMHSAARQKNPGKHLVWGKSAFKPGLKIGSTQSEQNLLTFPDPCQEILYSLTFPDFPEKKIVPRLSLMLETLSIKIGRQKKPGKKSKKRRRHCFSKKHRGHCPSWTWFSF